MSPPEAHINAIGSVAELAAVGGSLREARAVSVSRVQSVANNLGFRVTLRRDATVVSGTLQAVSVGSTGAKHAC